MLAASILLATLALAPAVAGGETIRREGEKPTTQTVNRHPWWYDKVKTDLLSGGDWLSNFSDDKTGQADYKIEIPRPGDYHVWLRANPTRSELKYRIDNGKWQEVDFSDAGDVVNVAADDRPDLRFLAWVKIGTFTRQTGPMTLAVRMSSRLHNHGAIDLILVTDEDFTPTGKGEANPAGSPTATGARVFAEQGTWPFQPPEDRFTDQAVLDLRHLNEPTAGQSGFIRLTDDGNDFLRGDGKPIRFWGVVSGGENMSAEQVDRHCRWLAKYGVNMVRIHTNLAVTEAGARITDVNDKKIDGIHRFVAAARKHGIYVTISPFWAHLKKVPRSWGLTGYDAMPWGLLFFNEHFQTGYKAWVRELYTRKNPYTGVALKDEPAVAIIQVKNEDSLLFYTFQGIKEPQRRILREQFAGWLIDRYGSLEQTASQWDGAAHPKDDFAAGQVGLYQTWEFTQVNHPAGKSARMADQLEFLARTMHDFYAEIARYCREDLGCKQLVNAMNWKSGDPVLLNDAERWAYTANEVIAVNRYTGGLHIGTNRGYRIDPGHYLLNQSVLRNPSRFPVALKQVAGHPFLITESAWTHPNRYQTEGPFLAAAYQSLTGVDVFYWFHHGEETWLRDPRRMFWRVGNSYALHKWSGAVPQQIGQFPAYAIAYRNGYIVRADEPVVHEERSLESIWQRRVPVISEGGTFDPIRDAGDFAVDSPIKQEVDRLAFLAGPVEVVYGGDENKTRVSERLDELIDPNAGTVRSVTGELTWDTRRGLCKVDTPRIQGVCGFLAGAGGSFQLGDVQVHSGNDYAAVAAVSMDGKPLAESKRILVQVGTVARLTGWTTREATFKAGDEQVTGRQIVNTGSPPWRLVDTKLAITIANPAITRATRLDEAGYRAENVDVQRISQGVSVTLPPNTMYLVLD